MTALLPIRRTPVVVQGLLTTEVARQGKIYCAKMVALTALHALANTKPIRKRIQAENQKEYIA